MQKYSKRRRGRTRLQGEVQDLLNRLDLLVGRRVEHDNDGADETYRAANLAQESQLFVQKV